MGYHEMCCGFKVERDFNSAYSEAVWDKCVQSELK